MDEKLIEFVNWRPFQVVAATVVVLLLSWSWVSRKAVSRGGVHVPPGPRGLPVVGSLLSLGRFPHKSLLELSKRYGPVMFLRLGFVPTLVVCNGEMVKEVLQTNDSVFASRPLLLLPSILFYDGMDMAFTPYGGHWRQARKICNFQLFTASRLSSHVDLIEAETMVAIQSILQESGSAKAVNISEMFIGLAMNVLTQIMWRQRHCDLKGSSQTRTDKVANTIRTVMALSGSNNIADFLPSFLKSLAMKLTGLEKKAKETHKEMDEFLEQIICEREQQYSAKVKTMSDGDDFVDILLDLTKKSSGDSEQFSRNTMKGILMDLLVGGADSTGVMLEWILAELMRHPDMMRKAQDELSRVVGSERLVTRDDIPNLKYLGAIVKEGLRRHGTGPMTIPHFSLGDCKVGGYDVQANTMVLINLFAVNHDSTVWDKPMEFNPDRFLESDLDYKGRHFEYLPFSSGRRICPGLNLASSVFHLGLAQLLHVVNWSLPQGQKPESVDMIEAPGLAIPRANPLFLIGRPRLSPHIIFSAPAVS